MIELLSYKLRGRGLPSPVKVSPIGIFQTCPECGHNSKDNRFAEDLFICTACGYSLDNDSIGSLNLARRLINYNKNGLKIKAKEGPDGTQFSNEVMGLNLCVTDPLNWQDKLKEELERLIEDFYKNKDKARKDSNFKKKCSMIKRLQSEGDFIQKVKII